MPLKLGRTEAVPGPPRGSRAARAPSQGSRPAGAPPAGGPGAAGFELRRRREDGSRGLTVAAEGQGAGRLAGEWLTHIPLRDCLCDCAFRLRARSAEPPVPAPCQDPDTVSRAAACLLHMLFRVCVSLGWGFMSEKLRQE